MDPPPAQDGKGRIAFDVVDGPSRVEAVLEQGRYDGQYVHGTWESATHVCNTPCVVNLPYGTYKMRFSTEDGTRRSEENVVVGASPTVYRYAAGIQQAPTGRVAGTAAPIVAAALAGGLVIGGAASDNSDLTTAGLLLHFGFDIAAVAVWQKARIRQNCR
jgi:hypothetical protein